MQGSLAFRGGLDTYWVSLSETRQEAEGILSFHQKSFGPHIERLHLSDKKATEERLKKEAGKYRMMHLATHGYFEPTGFPSMWEQARTETKEAEERLRLDAPKKPLTGYPPGLLSGLVLAGANTPPEEDRDDGYLTAEEVTSLNLTGCDLVVLSACETGIGTGRGGQGMQSLRRAFQEAGAKTVISSLWSVRDDSTRKLMTEFYLEKCKKALAEAK